MLIESIQIERCGEAKQTPNDYTVAVNALKQEPLFAVECDEVQLDGVEITLLPDGEIWLRGSLRASVVQHDEEYLASGDARSTLVNIKTE